MFVQADAPDEAPVRQYASYGYPREDAAHSDLFRRSGDLASARSIRSGPLDDELAAMADLETAQTTRLANTEKRTSKSLGQRAKIIRDSERGGAGKGAAGGADLRRGADTAVSVRHRAGNVAAALLHQAPGTGARWVSCPHAADAWCIRAFWPMRAGPA